MIKLTRIGGWILIGVGLVLALVAAPRSSPEGTWAETSWFGSRWVPYTLGLVAMLAGAAFVLYARRAAQALNTFLSHADEERILQAIRAFENRTSGEIRVHLARRAGGDILSAARSTFEALGMTATAARNGVLFFVDVDGHRFAVVGDRGIDERVAEGFWNDIVAHVRARFDELDFAGGLIEGIGMAGEALAQHFPIQPDDVNELPDDISRD